MVKRLLSFAVVAAMAFSASALDLPLTSEDTGENAPLYSGWGDSSYDQTTQTITYVDDWTGRGWWLAGSDLEDLSAYTHFVLTMEANIGGQITVQYSDDTNDTAPFSVGATEAKVALDPEKKNAVNQIYIQCSSMTDNPTIKLVKAELQDNSEAPVNYVVYEGEPVALNWWPGLDGGISKEFFPYLTPGAKIAITFCDLVTDGEEEPVFKLQTLNADWSQTWLPSLVEVEGATAEADGSDCHVPVIDGTIEVPINAADVELINTTGVQYIMLVGQAASVSKVEVIPGENGIAAVEAIDNVAPVYYNLQGIQVANPAQGKIYIVKRGNKATKEVIR